MTYLQHSSVCFQYLTLPTHWIWPLCGCASYGGQGAGGSVADGDQGGGGGHPVVHQPALPSVSLHFLFVLLLDVFHCALDKYLNAREKKKKMNWTCFGVGWILSIPSWPWPPLVVIASRSRFFLLFPHCATTKDAVVATKQKVDEVWVLVVVEVDTKNNFGLRMIFLKICWGLWYSLAQTSLCLDIIFSVDSGDTKEKVDGKDTSWRCAKHNDSGQLGCFKVPHLTSFGGRMISRHRAGIF